MDARNDHKGKQEHLEDSPPIVSVYASGQQRGAVPGPDVRADGNGGTMERGYYARMAGGRLHGPYSTRNAAINAAEEG